MFMLGRGRSFRTRNNDRLIRYQQDHLRVTGRVGAPSGVEQAIGVEVSREGTVARVHGRPAESLGELSQIFPVQVIDPGVHRLVEEGGYRRRRWLDWAVFHVEPRFMDTWLRYTRALKQRNAALKQSGMDSAAWDPELARLGESTYLPVIGAHKYGPLDHLLEASTSRQLADIAYSPLRVLPAAASAGGTP